jgi:hypothetical protein
LTLRLCFAHPWPPRKRRERPLSGRSPWAHWTPARRLVHPTIVGVSFWAPKENARALLRTRCDPQGVRAKDCPALSAASHRISAMALYRCVSVVLRLGTTWDLVGQIFPPCSPGDPTTHPACPPWIVVHPTESSWSTVTQLQRFRRVRTLTHLHGRIVRPPEVSPPGHSIAALTGRPWLRTPPKGGEFER